MTKNLATIDRTLLNLLVCPESQRPVLLASAEILEQLNKRIARGELHTTKGATVSRLLDGALVRDDNRRIYPIIDGIPVLLIEEGINL